MKRWVVGVMLLAGCTVTPPPMVPSTPVAAPIATPIGSQGWTAADRETFYTTPQGSRLIPYAWFKALDREQGNERFAADRLARYGYLANPDPGAELPIGFVVDPASRELGMTCAACHTGAIRYRDQVWRIDGGRGNADFQRFLTDLTRSLQATLEPNRLAAFTAAVAGPGASPAERQQVEEAFRARTADIAAFMDRSLPDPPWGAGRLDAFGMIFNRVAGLDLHKEANYAKADAPVRYPFIWNASFQDATQWNGAAPNGRFIRGLARNTGEVFGVFGRFDPSLESGRVRYASSVAARNLQTLESTIAKLKPPSWPAGAFGLDQAAANRGAPLFEANCANCHGLQRSASIPGSWATPVCRVGTDPKMADNARRDADTGVLEGTVQLTTGRRLGARALKLEILANAVIGSLVEQKEIDGAITRAIVTDLRNRRDPAWPGNLPATPVWTTPAECSKAPPRPTVAAVAEAAPGATTVIGRATAGLYELPAAGQIDPAYESRVLAGIWAAAPYLHNGSVPSLWQLLLPVKDRAPRFATGLAEFDPRDVGVAATPAAPGDFDVTRPGSSNQGHLYGTTLPDAAKRDLLEYLKTL